MNRVNPNYITSLRLFIFAPLACFFLMQGYLILALVSMIIGELTDFFDGFVARKTNQISNFGKIYDPMCDSISHMMIWISFLAIGWIPVYFVILFLIRDIIVSHIRIFLATHNVVLAARNSGKIKAITQALVQLIIVVFYIFLPSDVLKTALMPTVTLAAVITVYSLFDYSWGFCQLVREKQMTFK